MSKNDTKYCSNCCQKIESSKFFLHERMCSINVKKCPKCNKPFTVTDLDDHIEEVHSEIPCDFCKKNFSKIEIEIHKKKCDMRLVPCSYCEMEINFGELKEHQKACGSITEPCIKCGRYIQKRDMDKHLMEGCPPPKNSKKSVDVIRSNHKNGIFGNTKNNNNININDFIPDEVFDKIPEKIDIKIHSNYNKPNLQIRPPSGKKILNENMKKNLSNLGMNPNEKKDIISERKINNDNNNIRNDKISKTNRIQINNNNSRYNRNNNDYIYKQNLDKQPIQIKPINNDNKIISKNNNNSNIRINNRSNINNIGKNVSKPSFATNLSKGNLNSNVGKDNKKSEEEFRKSREKFTFKEAKNIGKIQNNNKETQKKVVNNNNKRLITDDDYMANFNFGEVDDEQLLQQVIEQSLKDGKKKK